MKTLAELIDYFASEEQPNGTAMLAALRELPDALADLREKVKGLTGSVIVAQAGSVVNHHYQPEWVERAAVLALLASPSPEKPR